MNRLLIGFALLLLFMGSMVAAEKVVLVGSGAPDPKDALIIERLEKMGFTLDIHIDAGEHPVDLNGVDLVFISESTTSGNIADAYANSSVPVVNCETWTYDDMGFAPNDAGFNDLAGDTLAIVKADHPITQGLPAEVQVYDPAIVVMTANDLQGDVEILAVRADDPTRIAISVYEKGAQTLKGETQARHVNIFPHSTGWGMVTDDGWKLIENSVLYALGKSLAVEPVGKLTTTWAGIKGQ
ncbi:hypothetical protein ACFL6S_37040 [Candidatus Poribacteria bacterium]